MATGRETWPTRTDVLDVDNPPLSWDCSRVFLLFFWFSLSIHVFLYEVGASVGLVLAAYTSGLVM